MQRRPTSIRSLGERYPRLGRSIVSRRGFTIGWRTRRIPLQCQGPRSLYPHPYFFLTLKRSLQMTYWTHGRPVPSWDSHLHPRDVHVYLKGEVAPYLSVTAGLSVNQNVIKTLRLWFTLHFILLHFTLYRYIYKYMILKRSFKDGGLHRFPLYGPHIYGCTNVHMVSVSKFKLWPISSGR
jgi:hypothetical protein